MKATRTKTKAMRRLKGAKKEAKMCMEIRFSIQVAAGNRSGNGVSDNNNNNNTQNETTSSATTATKSTAALV